jgi:hypothetical protein
MTSGSGTLPTDEGFEILVPLINLTGETDLIELEDNLIIRKITEAEDAYFRKEAVAYLGRPAQLYGGALIELKYLLTFRYLPGAGPVETGLLLGRANQVLSALRLFDRGTVGFPYVESRPVDPHSRRGIGYTWSLEHSLRPFGSKLDLSATRAVDFVEFWRRIGLHLAEDAPTLRTSVRLALSRFNSTYSRVRPEDRLIDAVIGLETLLVGDEDELRYRLSNRAGALLGESDGERESVRDLVAASYKARNKIVHRAEVPSSVKVSDEPTNLVDLCDRIERLLARGIKTVLGLPNLSRERLLNVIDDSFISLVARHELDNQVNSCRAQVRTES